MRGRLILIEGLDRSGKSTQADILSTKLNGLLVKFPDRLTPVGQIINQYLTSQLELPDEAAHLLFSANRWELAQSLTEALNSGKHVVLDRYIYSGIAYSLAKSGMNDYSWLYSPDKGLPKPDLTLFLTIDLDELSKRKGWGDERYEQESFQKKVKKCFLDILPKDPSVELVEVDKLLIEEVTQKLWGVIEAKGMAQETSEPLQKLT